MHHADCGCGRDFERWRCLACLSHWLRKDTGLPPTAGTLQLPPIMFLLKSVLFILFNSFLEMDVLRCGHPHLVGRDNSPLEAQHSQYHGWPQVKLLRDAEKRGEAQAKPKRPRALVLGPTRELTDQILSVAKSISHHAKFRSACVNGGVLP